MVSSEGLAREVHRADQETMDCLIERRDGQNTNVSGGVSRWPDDERLGGEILQERREDEDGDRWGASLGPVLMCGVDWRAVVFVGSENTR